jgi:hypothetical protein
MNELRLQDNYNSKVKDRHLFGVCDIIQESESPRPGSRPTIGIQITFNLIFSRVYNLLRCNAPFVLTFVYLFTYLSIYLFIYSAILPKVLKPTETYRIK